jgi:UDP:flavonoid glycosyltransferase YjiC (YdhE family)
MRFLLTSWGSHGDLHPFLALGRGLIARRHEVSLVGHPEWEADTRLAGLRFVSTGEPPRGTFLQDNPEIFSMRWGGFPSVYALVHRAIAPSFDFITAALHEQAPRHDVLIAHHFVFPAPAVAEMTGIAWATVSLAPGVVPSEFSLPAGDFGRASDAWHGRLRQRIVWSVGRALIGFLVDPAVNRLRQKHGLNPIRDATFANLSPHLNLQLYSEHFAPPPSDWSTEKRTAGFCYFDPPGAALSPEVEEFLQRGKPPVLFTLGSAAVEQAGAFYQHAVEALENLGLRGILLIGPERNRPPHLPESILAISYAPYGLLMPRVRAVVHQCGVGTLSHALRAGVPSVACPFAFDQPNNARRLETLGVAEVVLPHQRNARHIEAALQRLLSGDAPARAQALGKLIRAEDGVACACMILEETFAAK